MAKLTITKISVVSLQLANNEFNTFANISLNEADHLINDFGIANQIRQIGYS